MAGPEPLRLHLLLERTHVTPRGLVTGVEGQTHPREEQVHRLALLAHETIHPVELGLEFGLDVEADHDEILRTIDSLQLTDAHAVATPQGWQSGDDVIIVPALSDEDIFIRMVTASALGELGSPVAIPALIDALEDEESAVREAAYTALRTLTKKDLPFDPISEDAAARALRVKAWRDWWEKERVKYES